MPEYIRTRTVHYGDYITTEAGIQYFVTSTFKEKVHGRRVLPDGELDIRIVSIDKANIQRAGKFREQKSAE